MFPFVAAPLAVIALVWLMVAVISGNSGMAWFAIGTSTFGLLCLVGDELRQRGRSDGESDAASVCPGSSPPTQRTDATRVATPRHATGYHILRWRSGPWHRTHWGGW